MILYTYLKRKNKEDVLATQTIIVASSKGGVGKSTVALGIAGALNSLGKTVLLCDLDLENRCLDLYMGIENAAIFNVADVARGAVEPEKAVVKNSGGLSFLSAPADRGDLSDEVIAKAVSAAVDAVTPDFAVFDTGTAHGMPEILAKTFPHATALIVASHQASSTRGAEKTAALLEKKGIKKCRLVICGYEFKEASRHERSGVLEIIDSSRVPLAGVIPFDRDLMISHERGVRAPADAPSTVAFTNVAKRLCGKRVRLFDGIGSVKRRKII